MGLTLQSSTSWRNHIAQEYEKASKGSNTLLNFVTYKVSRSISTSLFESLIRALNLWVMAMLFRPTSSYDCDLTLLDSVRYEAARLVTGASKGTSSVRLYTRNLLWSLLVAEGNYTFRGTLRFRDSVARRENKQKVRQLRKNFDIMY